MQTTPKINLIYFFTAIQPQDQHTKEGHHRTTQKSLTSHDKKKNRESNARQDKRT